VRIAIDAHYLGFNESGNETYVRGLIGGLAETDGRYDYDVYVCDKRLVEHPPIERANFSFRYVSRNPLVRVAVAMPLELRKRPASLIQAHYNAPLAVPCPLVLVMHDISWDLMPHLFPRFKGSQIAWRAERDVRKARRVVVGSRKVRDDVARRYGLTDDTLRVVPLGVDARFSVGDVAGAARHVQAALGIGTPYVLYVGDLQPRKNLPRLVEAFALLKRRGDVPHRLVIAGKRAWEYEALFEAVERLGLSDDVVFTGYVPDEVLPDLYRAADLLVYPSIHEGFGLPPLEAMACGVPVAVSDEPTLRETTDGAAALFDPEDPEAIAEVIARVLGDESLRQTLKTRGLVRARACTWKTTAERMLAVYDEVLGV